MTLLPKVKLKVVPTFPGNIVGGVGIDATKDQGKVTIDMDWNEFGVQSALPTSPTNNVLTFDTATNSYVMIPSHLLGGAVAGISDAPVDGVQYGRQSAGWTPITASNFVQAGTGAVTRTMQNKVRESVSVKDYGAVGDGVANDTPAFLAAIAYLQGVGGGRLFIPRGIYNIASTLQSTRPIVFVGEGWGYSVTAFGSMAATVVTRLKWIGSNGPPFFQFQNLFYGWGISDLEIDGNDTVWGAVFIDSSCGGSLERVSAVHVRDFGLFMIANNNTTSWNTFSHTHWEGSTATGNSCIDIDRILSGVGANCCHNTFYNTSITHTGFRHGIYLGGCDNIVFTMTYIYAPPSTTGYGVYVDPTVAASFPQENAFFHLETDSWYQPASTTLSPATIWGLFQSTDPFLNGTPLVFERKEGTRLTPNSTMDITTSATTVVVANDTRYVRLLRAGVQQVNLLAASARYGAPITIIDMGNAGAGAKIIQPFVSSSDTINGVAASISIPNNFGVVTLLPNQGGTGWNVISKI